jgi:predicted transcriptional regulator
MCDPEETRGVILENILDKAFAGSASKLVRQAIKRKKTTDREIFEIIEYLSENHPLRA